MNYRKIAIMPALLACIACGQKTESARPDDTDSAGITYVEGKGLKVSKQTRQALSIQTAEITEGPFQPRIRKSVTFAGNAGEAKAAVALTAQEAADIKPGHFVSLEGSPAKGTVLTVSVSDEHLSGEREVIIQFEDSAFDKQHGELVFELPPRLTTIVPKTALLKTANGSFVYVPNEDYLFRTAVTAGGEDGDTVEILEGLYSGDEVVTKPVMALWLAELQAIKGGVSCADGH